jgi:SAM-dependent methyltransferase
MRLLDLLRRARRLRLYDISTTGIYDLGTTGTYEIGKALPVPAGQSIYDPAVFDRYDPSTQRVVSIDDDGIWAIGFDELIGPAQRFAAANRAVESDRYKLVLPLLTEGWGVCLDACTSSPVPEVRQRVEELGYVYSPIDISGDGVEIGREDVTSLTYESNSIARIMSLDTLEHVTDYRAALAEFQRVLTPGGVLFLHVPAYFFDRESSAPINPANDPWEHVRYFSARELVESIRASGLTVLRTQFHLDYGATLCIAGKSSSSA